MVGNAKLSPLATCALALAIVVATCAPGNWLGPSTVANALEDKIKELIKAQGIIELKIVEASVPDLDPLPMQKDSDPFVRVYLNDTKELLCETKVVQDENQPKVSVGLGMRP